MTQQSEIAEALTKAFGLHGKRAVVTGAGSGLAEYVAKALACAGASVVVAHHDEPSAARVVGEIVASGGSAQAILCDVADESSVIALFANNEAPDIVVLGAMQQNGLPAVEISAEQWDGMFSINTRGAFLTSREAIRRMRSAGAGGRIIALSTIGSERPMLHGNAAYGASRAALNQLCRNLAFEHAADGICVNAILPGGFLIDAPKMPGAETFQPTGPGLDMPRYLSGIGDSGDVGLLAVFLASPAARFITGQCFVIDGGFLLS